MPDPDLFGHYRILRLPDGTRHELGSGAMGVTYKAVDLGKGNRPVVLKLIRAEAISDPDARRLFEREASTLKELREDNIANYLDHGEEGGQCFCAMEFIEGETLETQVKLGRPLPWQEVLIIARQVAIALEGV